MLTSREESWLEKAVAAAKLTENSTGLPAALTLSQAVLESGYGAHSPMNNCFGLKGYENEFGKQHLLTHENIDGKVVSVLAWFATFPTLAACFDKHAEIITTGNNYRRAWQGYLQTKNVKQLAIDIAPVYATDKLYASKLLAIMASESVKNALEI